APATSGPDAVLGEEKSSRAASGARSRFAGPADLARVAHAFPPTERRKRGYALAYLPLPGAPRPARARVRPLRGGVAAAARQVQPPHQRAKGHPEQAGPDP